jgi:hypothetical protein
VLIFGYPISLGRGVGPVEVDLQRARGGRPPTRNDGTHRDPELRSNGPSRCRSGATPPALIPRPLTVGRLPEIGRPAGQTWTPPSTLVPVGPWRGQASAWPMRGEGLRRRCGTPDQPRDVQLPHDRGGPIGVPRRAAGDRLGRIEILREEMARCGAGATVRGEQVYTAPGRCRARAIAWKRGAFAKG